MAFTIDYRIDHSDQGFELFMLHVEGYDVDFGDAFATYEEAVACAQRDAAERDAVANIKIRPDAVSAMLMKSESVRLLEDIKSEASELLDYATAGGNRQYAFELMVDNGELKKMLDKLFDLGTEIRSELNI